MSSSLNSSFSSEPLPASALEPLHDVTCVVDVILGSTSMSVRSCLGLRRQSIVALAELAGSDMQVVVNGVPVARGEVVIVEDSTAIRITDIQAQPSSELIE